MGATRGTEETLKGLAGMFAMTRQVEVVRRWADGPDVITWFELSTETAGPLPVVNWSHVEDGRITRIRVTFDPRPHPRVNRARGKRVRPAGWCAEMLTEWRRSCDQLRVRSFRAHR